MEVIQNQFEGNRLIWFRHVTGIVEHRMPKRLLEMNTVARSSQERHRKKRTVVGEGRTNAGMDR
jgi:hypothetical protein